MTTRRVIVPRVAVVVLQVVTNIDELDLASAAWWNEQAGLDPTVTADTPSAIIRHEDAQLRILKTGVLWL